MTMKTVTPIDPSMKISIEMKDPDESGSNESGSGESG